MGMAEPIDIKVEAPASITLSTPQPQGISLTVSGGSGAEGEEYAGPYEVTPGPDMQVLRTERKVATKNIVINPVPSNYGLVTWNGSVLTVS